ncbi:MAG: hypothetical protein DRP09_05655 [Candidatus Thorarchaeota archaeon]|nr:MAG: hypothetical protein DRP09_05655 [Candidatus Thorarchaeota archaeon]
MDKIHAYCKDEVHRIQEIESIADTDSEEINKWSRSRGFQINLQPFGSGGFGIASVLDLLGLWVAKGKKSSVVTEDSQHFRGIKMTSTAVRSYHVEGNPNLIIEIGTRIGDKVHLMMADKVPSGLTLLDFVEQINREQKPTPFEYDEVIFPMIDLDEVTMIEWILGLQFETSNGKVPYFVISQALAQTKMKMNEAGFRVRGAVAFGILAGPPLRRVKTYMINRPFLMWIARPGFSRPLFIGYLNEDVWRDPGSRNM